MKNHAMPEHRLSTTENMHLHVLLINSEFQLHCILLNLRKSYFLYLNIPPFLLTYADINVTTDTNAYCVFPLANKNIKIAAYAKLLQKSLIYNVNVKSV